MGKSVSDAKTTKINIIFVIYRPVIRTPSVVGLLGLGFLFLKNIILPYG